MERRKQTEVTTQATVYSREDIKVRVEAQEKHHQRFENRPGIRKRKVGSG